MNKSTYSLLAATALVFAPMAALAQDAQQSLQINRNAGAAVGIGNVMNQQTLQQSNQNQFDLNNGYGYGESSNQISVQDNGNIGSSVGGYNLVNQGAYQGNNQSNTDVNTYPGIVDLNY